MMKILLKQFYISVVIIAFYLLFGTISYGDHSIMLFLILTTTFICSIIIFIKNNPKDYFKLILLLILPLPLINIIIFIVYGEYYRGLLYIFFIPVSSLLAYFYYKTKKIVVLFFSILMFSIVGFMMFPNVIVFLQNRNAETNLIFPKVTVYDKNNTVINMHQNKIIVLDFWTTSCSICFSKFPDFEKTYLKYRNNPNVKIYAINVPENRDKFKNTITILDKKGYIFPEIYAKSAKEIKDSLNIYSFPHLLILKNGRIRYDGILETEKNVFLYNIESEIDKLLTE